MAVRFSAPRAGRPLLPGRFLVLISIKGCVDPRAIVSLEGLGQLKNPMRCNFINNIYISSSRVLGKKLQVNQSMLSVITA
jgi:hypothetical protein